MKTAMAASALLVIGALGVPTHAARHEPIEHFVAQSALMTSPSRITFRPVEIEVFEWSTALNHHELATALLQKGHVAFFNLLCGFGTVGRISVIGAPDIAIRYAWSTGERRGNRRIYLATEEPVSLSGLVRPPLPGRRTAHIHRAPSERRRHRRRQAVGNCTAVG